MEYGKKLMCMICVDLIKQNMTWFEAESNSNELGMSEKDRDKALHYQDLFDALYGFDLEKLDKITEDGLNESN